VKRHETFNGHPTLSSADAAEHQNRSTGRDPKNRGEVLVRDGSLDGAPAVDDPDAVFLFQQLVERSLSQVLMQERLPDRRGQLRYVQRPRLPIHKSQPLDLHHRFTNGNLQSESHLIIRGNNLPPTHLAA